MKDKTNGQMEDEQVNPNNTKETEGATAIDDDTQLRRSNRTSKPTERMQDYMNEELSKREAKLLNIYEKWKNVIKNCKTALKGDCSEIEAGKLLDSVTFMEKNVIDSFHHVKQCGVRNPDPLIVRKVDACISLTNDIKSLLQEKIAGLDEVNTNYKSLKKNEYARSVFSDLSMDSSIHGESKFREQPQQGGHSRNYWA